MTKQNIRCRSRTPSQRPPAPRRGGVGPTEGPLPLIVTAPLPDFGTITPIVRILAYQPHWQHAPNLLHALLEHKKVVRQNKVGESDL